MVGLERGTVEIESHREAWHREYEAEVERLEGIAGDRIQRFEHVGSTAVRGLAAKPIIDLVAVVPDPEVARDLVPTLEDAGYEHRPDPDVPDRVFLARGPPEERTHYLSLATADSEYLREAIAFREYLRENPGTRREYESLKRDLAAANPDDRAAYTEAKSAFVEGVLQRALDR
jgi:GrpB-like predicted nucleotidyltransferase (UPF0157 family)